MKKSFVYLIVVLILATMLCACGMNEKDGVIGASPRPTDAVDLFPTAAPDTSSSMIPSVEPDADTSPKVKSPQIGATDGMMSDPNSGNTTTKK